MNRCRAVNLAMRGRVNLTRQLSCPPAYGLPASWRAHRAPVATEGATMTSRKTPSTPKPRQRPQANPAEPVKPSDEADHGDAMPHDHPQSDRSSRRPSADTRVNDGGRSGSEGNLETGTGDDEDSRSRRGDLRP